MVQYALAQGPRASAQQRTNDLVRSDKYVKARARRAGATRRGNMEELRREVSEWSTTRKVANGHVS